MILLSTSGRAQRAIDTTVPQWQPGAKGDLAVETSAFIHDASYPNPERILKIMSEDGAYSSVNQAWDKTHTGSWRISEQKYAFDAIVAGLDSHRQDVIEQGKKILDWGFRQEKPDGSFDCGDKFHGTAFFVEAAAHSALLLEASDMSGQNRAWVESIKPKLHRAALWMMTPANELPGRAHDAPYTHRYYLNAVALGAAGVLLHDRTMVEHSKIYIRLAIARQAATGANPEGGGWDTSYHAVGLKYAVYYYTLVADERTRQEMQPMIDRALLWLMSRMRENGTVDQTGNTSSGPGQEVGPNGTANRMSYVSAWCAAWYWAAISGEPAWSRMAVSLVNGNRIESKARNAATAP